MPFKPKILIADALHQDGLDALKGWAEVVYAPDRKDLSTISQDIDGLMVRFPITEERLSEMKSLKAIVRCGTGIDGIPTAYTQSRGIQVFNTPGANAESVAEYVFSSILHVARNFSSYADDLSNGNWQSRNLAREQSFEIKGLRLGILGMGAIGQRIAQIGHFGFDMEVKASTSQSKGIPGYITTVDIDTLCATSDILVLCCSLTDTTRGVISAKQLNLLRPRGILVNVARGAVINEDALINFANDPRRTVSLVLDVHHTSPLPANHPLALANNCFVTAHLAGLTLDSERRMAFATNQILASVLNPSN